LTRASNGPQGGVEKFEGQTTASRCPVAVDQQKQAKMLAQFWCRFHNGGIAVFFRFSQPVVCLNACQGMYR
jgi:hypothetical protein